MPARACLALLLAVCAAPGTLAQDGPLRHRLFVAPTAYPVEARRASVGFSAGVLPNAAVGLGRGVSADVHASPFGAGFVAGHLKSTVAEGPRGAFAAGVVAGTLGDGWHGLPGPFGVVAYGVGTLGTEDARVNLLAGVRGTVAQETWSAVVLRGPVLDPAPYRSPETFVVLPQPVLSAGADVRMSDGVRVVAEATLIPDVRYRYAADLEGDRWPPVRRGSGYGTLVAGVALRFPFGRAALDVGVAGTAGTAATGVRDGAWGAFSPFPWLALGVGL